ALGTAFDVYKAPMGTVVTVVEGRVVVLNKIVAAGEQLVMTPRVVTPPKRANIAAATAWTQRSLVFDASPLTEVAQEFNRYNRRRLVVESSQLRDFRISGVFSSVEPTLLLRFLRAQPELVVQETEG